MAYEIISQNNNTTTLSDGTNTITVPSRVVLATGTTYEITEVNNSTATLEGSDGSVIRDVPCVAVLAGGGSSLPDQAGHSGEFLTTDGTDASWSDKPLVNTATGTNALTILGTATTKVQAINIGFSSYATRGNTICIGAGAQALHDAAIAIGSSSVAGASSGQNSNWDEIAIGNGAGASAKSAIQLGYGTNNDAETFQVWNHRLLNRSDGTIPAGRTSPVVQIATATVTQSLTSGYIYNCGEMTSVGITLPATPEANFCSQINFTSGATPTVFTAPNTMKWLGDDVSSNAFNPAASKRYAIMVYYDGVNMRGIVQATA